MAEGPSSLLSKIIALACLGSFVVFVVGFSTSYWYKSSFTHGGLWQNCVLGVCSDYAITDSIKDIFKDDLSWLKATQAFETLGFIAAVAALILIVLYVFVPATSGKRIVFILSMVACFIAAGCILLGIIIYGTKMDYNLSWSFALCCIAGIIFAVAGLLLAIDFCKR
ncbi:lens fiber membrane intrinsic protein-like isoform X4 [Mya arenaria]|uniref:lens fiber membrane intrinsic protein-like isoform X4 n=1 Tax=Mya arenaria TaxID=6604 RepID=UPI0022DEE16A|nr:lens fiber membrane intrinsic protein-like isoform X4 [Mya arenaria]